MRPVSADVGGNEDVGTAGPRVRPAVTALLVALAAAPLAAAVARAGTGWLALQDSASIVLRSRDVLTARTPLLGMPTTLSEALGEPVHHLGPMGFWPSGLASALVDHRAAPMVATALVNLVAVAAIVLIAGRLGGRPAAALAAASVAVTSWSLRDEILIDPLNPYAGHLPLAAFLVAMAAVTAGATWALPVAVLVGSYAAQSHVSLVIPIAAVVVGAAVVGGVAARRAAGGAGGPAGWRGVLRPHRRPVIAALVVAAICWWPVLLDLLFGQQNLWRVARAGGGMPGDQLGAAGAWRVVARAVTTPVWLVDDRLAADLVAPVGAARQLLAVAVLAGAAALAWRGRRRHPAIAAALLTSLTALAGGGWALTKIPDNVFNLYALPNYLWLWPVTALLFVALLAAAVGEARERWSRSHDADLPGIGRATVAAAGAVALLAAVGAVAGPGPRIDNNVRFGSTTTALAEQVAARLDPDVNHLVEVEPGVNEEFVPLGLALELERRGLTVTLPRRFSGAVGEHRTDDAPPIGARLQVVQALEIGAVPDDADVLAVVEPDRTARQAFDRVVDEILAEVDAAGGQLVVLGAEGEVVHDAASARDLVRSGELYGIWSFGAVAEPRLPDALMEEYRRALDGPIRTVAVLRRVVEPPPD